MKLNLEFNHLKEVNQSYKEHAKDALKISKDLFVVSLKLVVHAIYPDVFTDDASKTCNEIVKMANKKRNIISETELLMEESLNENEVFRNREILEDSNNLEDNEEENKEDDELEKKDK
jgi:hypothetical protein